MTFNFGATNYVSFYWPSKASLINSTCKKQRKYYELSTNKIPNTDCLEKKIILCTCRLSLALKKIGPSFIVFHCIFPWRSGWQSCLDNRIIFVFSFYVCADVLGKKGPFILSLMHWQVHSNTIETLHMLSANIPGTKDTLIYLHFVPLIQSIYFDFVHNDRNARLENHLQNARIQYKYWP